MPLSVQKRSALLILLQIDGSITTDVFMYEEIIHTQYTYTTHTYTHSYKFLFLALSSSVFNNDIFKKRLYTSKFRQTDYFTFM